jgi:hypothetical protein
MLKIKLIDIKIIVFDVKLLLKLIAKIINFKD